MGKDAKDAKVAKENVSFLLATLSVETGFFAKTWFLGRLVVYLEAADS